MPGEGDGCVREVIRDLLGSEDIALTQEFLNRRSQELLDEWFKNGLLDKHTATGATILSGVGEHAHRGGFRRLVHVRVGENDVG